MEGESQMRCDGDGRVCISNVCLLLSITSMLEQQRGSHSPLPWVCASFLFIFSSQGQKGGLDRSAVLKGGVSLCGAFHTGPEEVEQVSSSDSVP